MIYSLEYSQPLRIALASELNIHTWASFADQWTEGALSVPPCESSACIMRPQDCAPSRIAISCNACIDSFVSCNIVRFYLTYCLKSELSGWSEESISTFVLQYMKERQVAVSGLESDPPLPDFDLFESGEVSAPQGQSPANVCR
jgi:hypothetical protein